MFAIAPRAYVLGLVGAVLLGSTSPVMAADRTTPQIDFTLASAMPFVPSVANVAPPAILTTLALDPKAAPLAEAAQMRPVDLVLPRAEGGSAVTSLRRSMYVSFAALQVFDAMSTRKALANGAVEANPAMSGIAKNSAALYAVKAGTAVATTFIVERIARNNPRRATIVMAVLNAAYAAVVVHNYRVAAAR